MFTTVFATIRAFIVASLGTRVIQYETMPFDLITGKFIPEKSNVWRDACDGYLDWVREHVEDGAPINYPDLCGDPPLVLAAGGGHRTVVKYLLEEGARIDQRNVVGETPLIRAAHNGHFWVCKDLVEVGADVNAVDLGDNTALHWAAMRGHVEIVKLLLQVLLSFASALTGCKRGTLSCPFLNVAQAGADVTAVNKLGRTPEDNCQPQWSDAFKYARQVFAQHK